MVDVTYVGPQETIASRGVSFVRNVTQSITDPHTLSVGLDMWIRNDDFVVDGVVETLISTPITPTNVGSIPSSGLLTVGVSYAADNTEAVNLDGVVETAGIGARFTVEDFTDNTITNPIGIANISVNGSDGVVLNNGSGIYSFRKLAEPNVYGLLRTAAGAVDGPPLLYNQLENRPLAGTVLVGTRIVIVNDLTDPAVNGEYVAVGANLGLPATAWAGPSAS